MRDTVSTRRRVKLDFLGAALVAAGMFLFVFALSEGGTYGWLTPVERLLDRRSRRVAGDTLGLDHAARVRGSRC